MIVYHIHNHNNHNHNHDAHVHDPNTPNNDIHNERNHGHTHNNHYHDNHIHNHKHDHSHDDLLKNVSTEKFSTLNRDPLNNEEITDETKNEMKKSKNIHIHKTNDDGEVVDIDIDKNKKSTVVFSEKDYDESKNVEQISKYLNIKSNFVEIKKDEIIKYLIGLPKIYTEPFADISQLPTLLLNKNVKNKVILTGDGGDELFSGYNRHKWLPRLFK